MAFVVILDMFLFTEQKSFRALSDLFVAFPVQLNVLVIIRQKSFISAVSSRTVPFTSAFAFPFTLKIYVFDTITAIEFFTHQFQILFASIFKINGSLQIICNRVRSQNLITLHNLVGQLYRE